MRWKPLVSLLCLVSTSSPPASGQPADETIPGVPVRTTEVIELVVRSGLTLTGTIEAPRTAIVACEVDGVVAAIPAREGSWVEKGAPLVRVRDDRIALRLEAAEGRLDEAKARLELAEQRLQRTRELSDSSVVSKQQVDDTLAESRAWAGRAREIAAEVRGLQSDLKKTTVKAPFAGVVGREHTEVGEWVGVGDPVAELISTSDLEVRVEVPERYFGQLDLGAAVDVVYGSDATSISGAVRAIVPRADATSRTFPVLIRLQRQDGAARIGAGMLATVTLPIGDPLAARLVPKDAIVAAGRERFLFAYDETTSTVERIVVSTGAGAGAWTVIEGMSLIPGQRVVTRGNERLVDGARAEATDLDYPMPPSGE